MPKFLERLKNRFKTMGRDEWIVVAALFVVFALLLYFSIGMSVSLSKGLTLFGDANHEGNAPEVVGPTSFDITAITVFWVVTALIALLFVYRLFFRKIEKKAVVRKEIVHGHTVIVKEEEKKDGQD